MTTDRPAPASAHTVQDFDARAATWDDDPTKVARARAIVDAMLREVPFDRSMVLFHDVVKILALSNRDSRLVDLIVVINRCRVAPTLINRDLFRQPLRTNSSVQERSSGVTIPIRGKEKINGLPIFVDGAI